MIIDILLVVGMVVILLGMMALIGYIAGKGV
jgi:hypothetical protein